MEWKIGKGGSGCTRCQKSFEDGEVYFSTIRQEVDLVQRYDYCGACFEPEKDGGETVFWRTRKSIEEPARKTVNFEVLKGIFFKMLPVEDRVFKEMAYLLALILIRKKVLKLKEFLTRDGVDCMAVRRKTGDPLFYVEVPLLRDEEIALLREKLSDLLDADLDDTVDVQELREKITPPPAEAPENG